MQYVGSIKLGPINVFAMTRTFSWYLYQASLTLEYKVKQGIITFDPNAQNIIQVQYLWHEFEGIKLY